MKINYILYSLLIALAGIEPSFAQSVMLEQHVDQDTVSRSFGRNRKHFAGTFMGFGTILGDTEGDSSVSMRQGRSSFFQYGGYYKLKLSKTFSLGGSGSYRYTKFDLGVTGDQVYNRLVTHEALAECALRTNYGRRGDFIGNYLEIGVSGDYAFIDKNKVKTKPDDPDLTYQTRKLVFSNLSYIEKLNYSAHVRLGFNKWVLTADYRLSDIINDNNTYNQPPMAVGVRFDVGA